MKLSLCCLFFQNPPTFARTLNSNQIKSFIETMRNELTKPQRRTVDNCYNYYKKKYENSKDAQYDHYRRDREEYAQDKARFIINETLIRNIVMEQVMRKKETEYVTYLRNEVIKQNNENTALRSLLDNAVDATKKDLSSDKESVHLRKKRKVSNHFDERQCENTNTNNSKEVKEDKINDVECINNAAVNGCKIKRVPGKYGGEFADIKGVKQLILTGKRNGKYWLDKNGRKRRIQNWYYETDEDASLYDVEKLLNHRQADEGMEYFVRWNDFDSSYDSWEPEEHFDDDAVIEKYWNQKKKSKKVKMNHFLDQALNNLDDAERNNVKETMMTMQNDYQKHMVKQVQDKIQFILSEKVTNNLAEFIADFLDECDGNLEKELLKNGFEFIKSMKLMMWQKNEEIDESESDDDDEEEQNEHQGNKNNEVDWDNPIPNYVDIITGGNVIKPALSPFGHVLSYETWRKILESSKCQNMCPFTKQKMNRRSLVKITHRNYHFYKDRIVSITKEQMDVMASMA